MHPVKCPPQSVFIRRYSDDMYMVGHEAVGPNLDTRRARRIGEQVKIKFVIAVFKGCPFATITALCDMVWNAGDHDAMEACQA